MPSNDYHENTRANRIEALSQWVLVRLTPKAAKRLKRYPTGGKTNRSLQRLLTRKAEKDWQLSKSTAMEYAQNACLAVSARLLNATPLSNTVRMSYDSGNVEIIGSYPA